MSEDLVAWLWGVLNEDDRIARQAAEFRYDIPEDAPWAQARALVDRGAATNGDRILARFGNPDAVRHDVEAKRVILRYYENLKTDHGLNPSSESVRLMSEVLFDVVRALASAYRYRDGYRQEWKP